MGPVYRSGLTDSSRWQHVTLRPGDIVISAPSKCGNTWLQMICALLIFQTPDLPAPLTTLSPWIDMRLRPIDELTRELDAQPHRRFLKTHTPLDGVPKHPDVTYLVVGRDPRDVAVSMDHHRTNLDDDRIHALLGAGPGPGPTTAKPTTDQRTRVLRWIHDADGLDSLRGVVAHLLEAWQHRDDPGVVLLHYADLSADLPGQMRTLAARLGLAVRDELIEAATFARMRSRADELAPDERLGLFASSEAFFRSGRSGQWGTILTPDDTEAYAVLLNDLAPPDFLQWLHR